MTIFPDMKTVLTIGSLQVTWYAVLILSGAFLAYFLSLRQFKKWGYKEDSQAVQEARMKRYLKTSF